MPIAKRGRKYQVTVHHRGERFRRSFDVYADAEAWESQTKHNLKYGKPVDMGDEGPTQTRGVTMAQLREETLTHHWAGAKSKKTSEMNSASVCEALGWDLPVISVTTRRVENMVIKLSEAGNSDATINRKLSALSTMLKYGQKHGYVQQLPDMSRKREPEHRIRWVTPEEEAEALAYFEHVGQEDMADFMCLALDTGFRRSELLRLQARDVSDGKVFIWESKSGRARSVPLTRRASAILGKRLNRIEKPTDRLFTGWTKDMIRYHWDRARHHMGLMGDPQFGIHVLRHTFCSRLAQRGVPIPAIKELAGHSSIVTTQRYVHMSPDNLRNAIGVLDEGTGLKSTETPHASDRGVDRGVAQNISTNGNKNYHGINDLETLAK
ncbi:integrase [Litchfieldella qijiaojingensis]|uniref:Integrase n=1 Tax=Litchfieldella qijiaojingensis TaxID=980347 RepID=A0ABQ2YRG6_9GAMM|nr:site-specific integrase [Halomonas qijiaojingensis]GGX91328.1 integrase [Halomonas qijiaojingensis]